MRFSEKSRKIKKDLSVSSEIKTHFVTKEQRASSYCVVFMLFSVSCKDVKSPLFIKVCQIHPVGTALQICEKNFEKNRWAQIAPTGDEEHELKT